MPIKMHHYNSKAEIQADKDKLLEELGIDEEYADELYRCNLLDYSDQCRVEKIRGLNFLLRHGNDD